MYSSPIINGMSLDPNISSTKRRLGIRIRLRIFPNTSQSAISGPSVRKLTHGLINGHWKRQNVAINQKFQFVTPMALRHGGQSVVQFVIGSVIVVRFVHDGSSTAATDGARAGCSGAGSAVVRITGSARTTVTFHDHVAFDGRDEGQRIDFDWTGFPFA